MLGEGWRCRSQTTSPRRLLVVRPDGEILLRCLGSSPSVIGANLRDALIGIDEFVTDGMRLNHREIAIAAPRHLAEGPDDELSQNKSKAFTLFRETQKTLVMVLPVAVGIASAGIFAIFPSKRNGLGYAPSGEKEEEETKKDAGSA
ncbi:hypothetical protein DY000_02049412 [Brassica cretica]|uniref:Uncharacterized protein n=1 Tax=Brassica cretica TaxID=69181 RepID=A0ABQ7EQT0_BRACR|nr:hypothetical protein DY000_02049412 [Brassica cretica]